MKLTVNQQCLVMEWLDELVHHNEETIMHLMEISTGVTIPDFTTRNSVLRQTRELADRLKAEGYPVLIFHILMALETNDLHPDAVKEYRVWRNKGNTLTQTIDKKSLLDLL